MAAQRRGFNLLVRSVGMDRARPAGRILALARKSDGLILHDRVLEPDQMDRLSRQVPIVTLAGYADADHRERARRQQGRHAATLARHLLRDHGYPTLAYLGGHADSPDSIGPARERPGGRGRRGRRGSGRRPELAGLLLRLGRSPGDRPAARRGPPLPRAIACANDQTALGVMSALRSTASASPGEVAVTGFDDIPMARHLRPSLTTVRQPIQELGATAFEVLYSMISTLSTAQRDIVLPTGLIRRESCGCPPRPTAADMAAGLRGMAMRVITRRLLFYIVTAIAAITVDFFIPRLMPGNPVEAVLARLQGQVSPGTIRALELQYGVTDQDRACGASTSTYWSHLLHGNLGISHQLLPVHGGQRDPGRAALDGRPGRASPR